MAAPQVEVQVPPQLSSLHVIKASSPIFSNEGTITTMIMFHQVNYFFHQVHANVIL